MRTVNDLMSTTVLTAAPDDLIGPVRDTMLDSGVHCVPVVDDADFIVLMGSPNGTVVGQAMATDPDDNIPVTGAWQITAANASGSYAIADDSTISVAEPKNATELMICPSITASNVRFSRRVDRSIQRARTSRSWLLSVPRANRVSNGE